MKALLKYLSPLLAVLAFGQLKAQNTYYMSDQTVNECEGILFDSDAGLVTDYYDHNEDFTFTICVSTADNIVMTFSEFCSEEDYDFITFHDGPNTNSPIIAGPFSGTISIPPISASSGCLTVHFTTDANVACTGWVASWETIIIEPEPPVFNISPIAPTCSTSTVSLVFDDPIPCDSVYPDAFDLDGPVQQNITSITPVNCNNGTATQFQVNLSPGMNESGNYDFDFTYYFVDECDNFYVLNSSATAGVNDCPLQVELEASENPICPGTCTEIEAIVTGGDPNSYSFVWSNGLPNSAGPHTVCLSTATNISVTVSDAGPSASSSASILIDMLPTPTAQNDVTVCESAPPFNLTANPTGGEWYGPGISNGNNGTFHPDSGNGSFAIYYEMPNGCFDSTIVDVTPISAGFPEASCPGAAPFMVAGFYPGGGTWSGPNIQSDGTFDPVSQGAYDVTYTHPNGCSDTKTIYVDNISIQGTDTLCQSLGNYNLTFSPIGGSWTGSPGIVNGFAGTFNTEDAGPGSHMLTYTVNGCSEQVEIYVKGVNAGGNISACPLEPPFIVGNPSPSGGVWSGIGITDPNTGMYNPGVTGGQFNDTLRYTVDGCVDKKIVYVRFTKLTPDTIEFCESDDVFNLNYQSVGLRPSWGVWAGNGIVQANPNGTGKFSPSAAGAGAHTLTYTVNNCSDEVVMVVHSLPELMDTATCSSGTPITLQASPTGGTWDGDGIINPTAGLFDPQDVNVGLHTVIYESPQGCIDSLVVDVYQLTPANLNGLSVQYCYADSNVVLDGTPVGGFFSGPGVVDSIFNPWDAGGGQHEITYTFGYGSCAVTDEAITTVSPPISTTIDIVENDSICHDEVANITITASGGDGSLFNYNWDMGLGYGNQKVVDPDTSSQYIVITSDGCSEDKSDTINIHVFPKFTPIFQVGDSVCYDAPNSVEASVIEAGSYSYLWHSSPPQVGQGAILPAAHDYDLTITDNISGCSQDTFVRVPGFEYVLAGFSPVPDGECIQLDEPLVSFTDLSTGGTTGYWDFGDGTTTPYEPTIYPQHEYQDTGQYVVSLIVENDGGCADTTEKELCVTVDYKLHIPNTFTPNGDGLNDVFQPVGVGIVEFRMDIFNRWGEKVYVLNSIDDYWDGTLRGSICPNGVFAYYVYAYVLVDKKKTPLKLKGSFHLLRGEKAE